MDIALTNKNISFLDHSIVATNNTTESLLYKYNLVTNKLHLKRFNFIIAKLYIDNQNSIRLIYRNFLNNWISYKFDKNLNYLIFDKFIGNYSYKHLNERRDSEIYLCRELSTKDSCILHENIKTGKNNGLVEITKSRDDFYEITKHYILNDTEFLAIPDSINNFFIGSITN